LPPAAVIVSPGALLPLAVVVPPIVMLPRAIVVLLFVLSPVAVVVPCVAIVVPRRRTTADPWTAILDGEDKKWTSNMSY